MKQFSSDANGKKRGEYFASNPKPFDRMKDYQRMLRRGKNLSRGKRVLGNLLSGLRTPIIHLSTGESISHDVVESPVLGGAQIAGIFDLRPEAGEAVILSLNKSWRKVNKSASLLAPKAILCEFQKSIKL